jgi:hypothetical protein
LAIGVDSLAMRGYHDLLFICAKGDPLMNKKLKKTSLCKWGKDDVKKNWDELADILATSKFVCGKCLRSSRLKGTLCKPEKLAQSHG